MKQPLLITALFIFAFSVEAQTFEDLKKIDTKHQTCLDKGTRMLACSQSYYSKLNSLLNATYNKALGTLDSSGKAVLKKEQEKWLNKKEVYFQKIDENYATEITHLGAGNDKRMMIMDEKAQFVRERVEELLKRLGRRGE